MSLVNKSLKSWSIYAGIPVKKIKDRKKRLLELINK
jgi:galactoside O-acetyltransferase